jgi:hypothetical protein
MLLLEAGSRDSGEFRNPEERERPPLEAVTKTWLWTLAYVRVLVNCGV